MQPTTYLLHLFAGFLVIIVYVGLVYPQKMWIGLLLAIAGLILGSLVIGNPSAVSFIASQLKMFTGFVVFVLYVRIAKPRKERAWLNLLMLALIGGLMAIASIELAIGFLGTITIAYARHMYFRN